MWGEVTEDAIVREIILDLFKGMTINSNNKGDNEKTERTGREAA
jgi:hypothetical protein